MTKQRNWWIFFYLVVLIASLFAIKAFFELHEFFSLKEKAPLHSLEPRIIKLKKGVYNIRIHYEYEVGNQRYSKIELSSRWPYKNRWAAQKALEELENKKLSIWYAKKHPEKGHLNKFFPYKRLFSAFLLFGISIYFYFLRRYMLKLGS